MSSHISSSLVLFVFMSVFAIRACAPSRPPVAYSTATVDGSFYTELCCCRSVNQSAIEYIAENIRATYEVLNNLDGFTVQIVLHNSGNQSVTKGNWQLYFYQFFRIQNEGKNNNVLILNDLGMKLTNVQASLYCLEPTESFRDLIPEAVRNVRFKIDSGTASKSYILPNWYVTAPGLLPKTIKSTSDDELRYAGDFESPQKWKRHSYDTYNPFTAQERFQRQKMKDINGAGKWIVPTPLDFSINNSKTIEILRDRWIVVSPPELQREADFLGDKLSLRVTPTDRDERKIHLILGEIDLVQPYSTSSDVYSLETHPSTDVILIKGRTPAGVFYGIQSLLSLIAEMGVTPFATIKDAPRYEYRGVLLDVVRNFRTKDEVIKLMDVMAMYKMNKLHLHLSDDEGWRLEIPGLEELTKIGSKRCHDLNEEKCILPQLGSGPDDSTIGSGYYSRNEYRGILKAARQRHIEIIPAFSMPSHAHAAVRAMGVRYTRLVEQNGFSPDKYVLNDVRDATAVQNKMDVCLESTYTFIEHIVDSVKDLHKTIMPLRVFHFGGKELIEEKYIGNSSRCQAFITESTDLPQEFNPMEYFVRRAAEILSDRGIILAGWEEAFMLHKERSLNIEAFPNDEMYAYAWNNVWESGSINSAYKLANKGYKVVMAPATHLNFDHAYEPDPEERGLYWATRFTDTAKVFGFLSDSLYSNADVDANGEKLAEESMCGVDQSLCTPLGRPENIIGLQGQLWSKQIRTEKQLQFMTLPRLLALAERSWHKAPWEVITDKVSRNKKRQDDWMYFANTLGYKEMRRLDEIGVNYRIPLPGAEIENGKLLSNVEFPGLKTQYSNDNGLSWKDIARTEGVPTTTDPILLRTQSASGRRFSRPVSFSPVQPLPAVDEHFLTYFADNVDLHYDVLDNFQDGTSSYLAKITLENNGNNTITAGLWQIYFCSIYMIEPDMFSDTNGAVLEDYGVKFSHINGCLFKLEPVIGFKDLVSGEKREIKFKTQNWSVSKTDVMPNWYITMEGIKGHIIKSTKGESLSFVGEFKSDRQWKRYNTPWLKDLYDPYLPRTRFNINQKTRDMGGAQKAVIPTPTDMIIDRSQSLSVSAHDWVIETDESLKRAAYFLSGRLNHVKVTTRNSKTPKILLQTGDVTGAAGNEEAYSLKVSPDQKLIEIIGVDSAGVFYGIQSLLSLINDDGSIPKVLITDMPRYKYRGMHLDVGRHFHSKQDVMKLLDVMAMYKLNKFHFHLTDDEGWRLEIPGLEELTEIGGKSCHDLTETECIIPQLASGPRDTPPGSGYYTTSDYKEILKYAADRHIEVIPEFDTPGHARAAIKSMEGRYRKYSNAGNEHEAKKYLLSDLEDSSKYSSVQMFTDNALNPCLLSTISFMTKIISEVVQLHSSINPLKTFHFGGDEVAEGAWLNSSSCQTFINQTSYLDAVEDLKEYYALTVSQLIGAQKLNAGAWEDGLMKTNNGGVFKRAFFPNAQVYGYAWNNVWEWGSSDRAHRLANAGYKTIMAQATHLYFDHPYEPDPEERGFYWAPRFTSTEKVFGFLPDDLYANIDVKTNGEKLTFTDVCGPSGAHCEKLKKPENIEGMQGHLWSETVRTSDQLDYMIFPRLIALAERAWHKASWESDPATKQRQKQLDWETFTNSLGYKEMKRLDALGIKYRVPPPGGRVQSGKLLVNTEIPGLKVEMSRDGGKTWKSAMDNPPIEAGEVVYLRTRSADGKRFSRMIRMVTRNTEGFTQSSQTLRSSALLIVQLISLVYIAQY